MIEDRVLQLTGCKIIGERVRAALQPGGSADRAYMWDLCEEDNTKDVGHVDDFDIETFATSHDWASTGLFKPDIFEIARQIPADGEPAFVTTEPTSIWPPDCFDSAGLHKGTTKRLKKKMPS